MAKLCQHILMAYFIVLILPFCFLTSAEWSKNFSFLSQGRNSRKRAVSQIPGIICIGLLVR